MNQHISLDNINPSDLKNYVRKLCIVSNKYAKNLQSNNEFKSQLRKFKEYKSSHTTIDKKLQTKINHLEEELNKTIKERDKAAGENKVKIDEVNKALISMKSIVSELLHEKKQRLRHLEKKINKEI